MKLIKNLSCALFFFLLVVLLFAGYFSYDYFKNSSETNESSISAYQPQSEIIFKVNSGETVSQVIEKLYDQKFIKNKFYFQIFAKINKFENIQAGFYKLVPGSDFQELVESLRTPFEIELKISFVEGLRADEIAEKISTQFTSQSKNKSLLKFSTQEFLDIVADPKKYLTHPILNILPEGKTLEGLLFPDTYSFPEDVTTKKVITTFLDNFQTKFNEAKATKIELEGQSLTDYEKIILASIVEKEGTGKLIDNKLISGIFYNRLNGGLGHKLLQSDVVILYQLKDWKAKITMQDLQNTSYAYNTHTKEGLPPGPISNMGLVSLISAFSPTKSDYLFFIADKQGIVRYAIDYQEHLNNVAKYLE